MSLSCKGCGAILPIAGQFVGTTLGVTPAAVFGFRAKSALGRIVVAVAPIVGGLIVDSLAAPLCGNCKQARA